MLSRFGNTHVRATALLVVLLFLNVFAWLLAFITLHNQATLLGAAVLAYSYGLRHAVDADHIAAIDNVTRKLMQEGKQAIGIGAFFSLGHSSVVIIACFIIAITSEKVTSHIEWVHQYGAIVGTLASSLFLLVLALLNARVFYNVFVLFCRVKRGQDVSEQALHKHLSPTGVLASIYRFAFNLVNKSWQMYFVGFLFGLGFDTATEVGLLGISTTGVTSGVSIWVIMIFPLLFASGMALIDSLDNFVMVGTYGWAFNKPIRKLYYNMTITATSVVVALIISGAEALGLIAEKLQLHNGLWSYVITLNENMGSLGYAIVILFVLCWGIAALNYRIKGYDALEE